MTARHDRAGVIVSGVLYTVQGPLGESFSPPSPHCRRSNSFVSVVPVFQGQIVNDRMVFRRTFLPFRLPLFALWDEPRTKPKSDDIEDNSHQCQTEGMKHYSFEAKEDGRRVCDMWTLVV